MKSNHPPDFKKAFTGTKVTSYWHLYPTPTNHTHKLSYLLFKHLDFRSTSIVHLSTKFYRSVGYQMFSV